MAARSTGHGRAAAVRLQRRAADGQCRATGESCQLWLLVGNTLRGFNGYAGYSNFEISGPRWVHVSTGWNWLTCVRYYDRGQRRTYVFFIDSGAVAASRYSVLSDQCGAQQYLPLDAATGTITAPAPAAQETASPMLILQQPIY